MKKKVIALDIDDVLIDFNNHLMHFHNARYATSYTRAEITSFVVERLWGCSHEEGVRRILEFYDSKEHTLIAPLAGAYDILHKYLKKFTYIGITARPPSAHAPTHHLLKTHYPELVKDVHFLDHVHSSNLFGTKADVCKKIAAVLLVEDSLHNAEIAVAAGIPVLLIDTPWNQTPTLHPLIRRVFDWSEIDTIFTTL